MTDEAPAATQLYLISPLDVGGDFPDRLEAALSAAPVAAFQFRVKGVDQHEAARLAAPLQALCAAKDVAFIVNDDPHLARELDADGVHLGGDDASVAEARRILGDAAIIGVSCYDDLARARRLASDGADYLAFGAFFPSPTKPHARRASLQLLRDSDALGLPRVAIGGITPENGGPLVAAGADLLAVISGVFDAADPAAAARAYLSCFKDPTPA